MEERSIRIADGVYGYIELSDLEREVLDHPITQRLRYVSQNGLAQLVYPEVRTSRLSHSLGTLHLVSRLLASCLRNASDKDRQVLMKGFRAVVHDLGDQEGIVTGEKGFAALRTPDVFSAHRFCASRDIRHVQLIEQALRLAAMFHDLGHLPFSHDFEHAIVEHHGDPGTAFRLKGYRQASGALHEQVGHQLARLVFADLSSGPDGRLPDESQAIFQAAYRILEAPATPLLEVEERPLEQTEVVLSWLHSLIDGEVDADRCDYLLRDGRSYGFAFSDYDLERLLANLSVRFDRRVPKLIVRSPGLSSLEGFLLGRMRLYQYGIFHHKVVQVGQALRHCIRRMLGTPGPGVEQFIKDTSRVLETQRAQMPGVRTRTELLRRYARYDDSWWINEMRQFFDDHLRRGPSRDRWWFRLVLERHRGPESLWKRSEQPPWLDLPPITVNKAVRRIFGFPRDEALVRQWNKVVQSYRGAGVLVCRTPFEPWRPDPLAEDYRPDSPATYVSALLVEDARSEGQPLYPASVLSPLIGKLWEQWDERVQIYAFRIPTVSVLEPARVVERLLPIGSTGGISDDNE